MKHRIFKSYFFARYDSEDTETQILTENIFRNYLKCVSKTFYHYSKKTHF